MIDNTPVTRTTTDPRLLKPHPANRPFSTTDEAWRSFMLSIREAGIIDPLICRPLADDDTYAFEIVCGHRRCAAAIQAGLSEVPVEVREMDDKTAVAIITIENLHRLDPTPLQQAAGIAQMLSAGWSMDEVGAQLGMATSVVARRSQLNALTEAWVKRIEDSDHQASKAPVGVLERIARLPAETQARLAHQADLEAEDFGCWWLETVDDFRRHIEQDQLQSLAGVPWSLDDATLVPEAGACRECVKRSSAQPLLWEGEFEEAKQAADRCLDSECFAAKRKAAVVLKVAEKKAAMPDLVVLTQSRERTEKTLGGCPVVKTQAVCPSKKREPGSVPAIAIDGAKAGEVQWVRVDQTAARKAGVKAPKSKKAGQVKTLRERRSELQRRRMAFVVHKLIERLETEYLPMDEVPLVDRDLIQLSAAFGTLRNNANPGCAWPTDGTGKATNKSVWNPIPAEEACGVLWRSLVKIWCERMRVAVKLDTHLAYADAQAIAGRLRRLSWTDMNQEAERAIPEPKGWANLNADGTPKAEQKRNEARANKTEDGKKERGGEKKRRGDAGTRRGGEKQKGKPVYYEAGERIRLNIPTARKTTVELLIAEKREGVAWISGVRIYGFGDNGTDSYACDLTGESPEFECREDAVLAAYHVARVVATERFQGIVGDLRDSQRTFTKLWQCSECQGTDESKADLEWARHNLCMACEWGRTRA